MHTYSLTRLHTARGHAKSHLVSPHLVPCQAGPTRDRGSHSLAVGERPWDSRVVLACVSRLGLIVEDEDELGLELELELGLGLDDERLWSGLQSEHEMWEDWQVTRPSGADWNATGERWRRANGVQSRFVG